MPTEDEKAATWRADRRRRAAHVAQLERQLAGDAAARKALADKTRPIRGRVPAPDREDDR